MRVFVSGATGLIGGQLVKALMADGHQVRGLARPSRVTDMLEARGVDIVRGDLIDRGAVRSAVAGCDAVYHAAAVQPTRGIDKATYHAVNVRGTEHVARAAREVGVGSFVHCSTVAVYGRSRAAMVDERSETRPDGEYAVTKLRSESIVFEQCGAGSIPVTIARLTRVYGPGDLAWLRIFKDVLSGRFVMIGPGTHPYHVTYIDDVVAGLKACGGNARAGCYIIGSDEVPTLGELVEIIAEEGGVAAPTRQVPAFPFRAAAAAMRLVLRPLGREADLSHKVVFFTREHAFDTSKARAELAFHPTVSLREGVRRTIDWYRSHGYL